MIIKKALVILSGGQDSTTCLFWAKQNYNEVHAITFDYGQRHKVEINAAKKVAKLAQISSHEIIDVPNCLISSSPLTSKNDLELYTDYESMSEVIGNRQEVTLVPMRNALFLTIAANRAEAKNIKTIVTGVCQMDDANYDDCRQLFIDSTEKYINKYGQFSIFDKFVKYDGHTIRDECFYIINTALGHDHRETVSITVETPLMFLNKAESINLASKVGALEALAFSHTCYAGEYPPCGRCHSCVLRAQGFKDASVEDPLLERVKNG